MITAEKKTRYTVEDYMLLEEGAPFQLINYDLIMSTSPNSKHQLISMKLTGFILDFLKRTKNQGLFLSAPTDVKLDDGNIYQPDLIYAKPERKAEIFKDIIEGAPDLVIEILSPLTVITTCGKKRIFMRNMVSKNILSLIRSSKVQKFMF